MNDIVNKLKEEQAIDNFQKWFANSKTLNSNGEPKVLYCGTLSNFNYFDINKTTNESFLGKGHYFSDEYEDVNANYSNDQGPDFLIKKDSVKQSINENISSYLSSDYYADFIQNEELIKENKELYNVIVALFNAEEEGEDLFDVEGVDLFIEHESNRILGKENEGFIMPVYLKIEKPLDIDKDIFEQEETITGKKFDLIISKMKENKLNDYALIRELIYLMPDVNIEYSLSFEEFSQAFESAFSYELEMSDDSNSYQELLNFAEQLFDDEEMSINYSLSGEIIDFKNAIVDILNDYGHENSAQEFLAIFDSQFEYLYEGISVSDILTNEDLLINFGDLIILEAGIQENENTHFKGLCSLAFQRMGYDGIILDAQKYFKTMKNIEGATHYIVFESNQIKSAIGNNGEYSISNDDIRYRINYRVKKENQLKNTVSNSECTKLLKKIKTHFPKAPEIIIVTDKNSLDKDFVEKNPTILDSSGYYLNDSNKVLVMLQNVEDRNDLIKTITHEIFGHMSLKQVLNSDYERTMDKIYSYYESKGELENEKKIYTDIYKLDLSKSQDRAKIAEEKMATFIELNGFHNFPLKNVIIGAVKRAIRRFIPELNFNQNDIIYIAQKTHDNLKKDKKKKNKIKNYLQ